MTHSDTIWQIISALAVILTVLATYLKGRFERRTQHAETTAKLDTVQTTVNGETKAIHNRVEELTAGLAAAGVEVPKASTDS